MGCSGKVSAFVPVTISRRRWLLTSIGMDLASAPTRPRDFLNDRSAGDERMATVEMCVSCGLVMCE